MTTTTPEHLHDALKAPGNNGEGYVHRVRHDDIMRGLIEGVRVPTMCGIHMPIGTRDGDVDETGGGLPHCPACKELFARLA